MKKARVLRYRRLRLDWADAESDLVGFVMLRVYNRFILAKRNSVRPYQNFGLDVSMKHVCKCKLSKFWIMKIYQIKYLSFSLSIMSNLFGYPNFG